MEWSRTRYESLDRGYEDSLQWILGHRKILIIAVTLIFLGSLTLIPLIGTEFLPVSDESQFRIGLRAPVGQRVEKTEQQVSEVERVLRANIPATELQTIISSTGVLSQGRSSLFNPNTGPHTSSIQV
jgi:multidrug efflux pump subunit AcrB